MGRGNQNGTLWELELMRFRGRREPDALNNEHMLFSVKHTPLYADVRNKDKTDVETLGAIHETTH